MQLIKNLVITISLLALTMSLNVNAVEVEDLYQGKVLVSDRTQKSRMQAHKRAISQVFEKVTGDTSVLNLKKIQTVINYRSANYITSFSYVTDEHDRTLLVDKFDQNKIDKLLKSVGASIWGKRRPSTLVWLVKEEGINRSVVEAEFNPQLTDFITQSAQDKGLPVLMPKMDIVDKNNLFTSDIWGRFYNQVRRASVRYNIDNILIARMRYVDKAEEPEYENGWLLEYELINNKAKLLSGSQNGNQFDSLRNMISHLGQHFASQYAVKSEELGEEELTLVLKNYKNSVGLVAAERLLDSISAIDSVELKALSQQEAHFHVELSGESLDVQKALKLLDEFKQLELPETEKIELKAELTIEEQLAQLDSSPDVVASLLGNNDTEDKQQKSYLYYEWRGN